MVPATGTATEGGLQKTDGNLSGNRPPSRTPSFKMPAEIVHLAGLGVNPLIFKGSIAGKSVKIMVDSGSAGDFISQHVVDRLGLNTQRSGVSSKVQLADGTQLDLDTTTSKLLLTMGTHLEHTKLSVLPLEGHEVILGRPWLQRWNPTIDWRQGTMCVQNGILRSRLRTEGNSTARRPALEGHLLTTLQVGKALRKK